jgi:integrase
MRGRPPLPVGAYGSISFLEVAPKRVRAGARFRDYDRRVRCVAAFGPSRASAERRLKESITSRNEVAGAGEITRNTRVRAPSARWLTELETTELAKPTRARYGDIADQFIVKGVGHLRLHELTVPAVDRLRRAVSANHGAATAKGCKSVLSGMCGLALRHGAMSTNPALGVTRITAITRKQPRALTADEERQLVKWLAEEDDARRLDIDDLVSFMLGTRARIGEACALRVAQVDLSANTIEINATATKFGLEERPKTRVGWRVIAVPVTSWPSCGAGWRIRTFAQTSPCSPPPSVGSATRPTRPRTCGGCSTRLGSTG